MPLLEVISLTSEQKERIYQLWNQEYPEQITYKSLIDLDSYLNNKTEPRHYFLQNEAGAIEGWAFTFIREGEKWFVLLVDGKVQGQGKGSWLLNQLKEKEGKLRGWVVDHNHYRKQIGEAYQSPLKFYEKNGFRLCSDYRLETEQLSAVKIVWEPK